MSNYNPSRITIYSNDYSFPRLQLNYQLPYGINDIVTYDEYYSSDLISCPFCEGTGQIKSSYSSELTTCPQCLGDGTISYPNLIKERYGKILDYKFSNAYVGPVGHELSYLIQPGIIKNNIFIPSNNEEEKWIKMQRYASSTADSISLNFNDYYYDDNHETVKARYIGNGKYFNFSGADESKWRGFSIRLKKGYATSKATGIFKPSQSNNTFGIVFGVQSSVHPNWDFYTLQDYFSTINRFPFRYNNLSLYNNQLSENLKQNCPFCKKEYSSLSSGKIIGKNNLVEDCPICEGDGYLQQPVKQLAPWSLGLLRVETNNEENLSGGVRTVCDGKNNIPGEITAPFYPLTYAENNQGISSVGTNAVLQNVYPIKANDLYEDSFGNLLDNTFNIIPIDYTKDPLCYWLLNFNIGFNFINSYVQKDGQGNEYKYIIVESFNLPEDSTIKKYLVLKYNIATKILYIYGTTRLNEDKTVSNNLSTSYASSAASADEAPANLKCLRYMQKEKNGNKTYVLVASASDDFSDSYELRYNQYISNNNITISHNNKLITLQPIDTSYTYTTQTWAWDEMLPLI